MPEELKIPMDFLLPHVFASEGSQSEESGPRQRGGQVTEDNLGPAKAGK